MEKYTLDELRKKAGINYSMYDVANRLKRTCGIKHTDRLNLDQWDATLEFLEENYDYSGVFTLRKRVQKLKSAS